MVNLLLALVFPIAFAETTNPYAAYSYTYTPACVFPTSAGKLEFISNIPGCTEKSRKPTKDGETVTYQMTLSGLNADGSAASRQLTQTIAVTRTKGRLATVTVVDGENLKGAPTSYQTVYNTDAENPMTVRRTLVTQTQDGKKENFVIYDQEMCARMKASGLTNNLVEKTAVCAEVFDKYLSIINEFGKKFGRENLKIGHQSWDLSGSFGAYGYMNGKSTFREVRGGNLMELGSVLGSCGMNNINSYGISPSGTGLKPKSNDGTGFQKAVQ